MSLVKDLVVEYLNNKEYLIPTSLCSIIEKFGSDKGNSKGDGWHNYTTLYSKLFDHLKDEKVNIFEVGLGTNYTDVPSNMGVDGKPGASLYAWEEYFSKGDIYGADIDKRILFDKNRIKTYFCDQRDHTCIKEMFKNINKEFDVIIDDGDHEFNSNYTFLVNSISNLKKGGIYIIEDMLPKNVLLFQQILSRLQTRLNVDYIEIVNVPSERNNVDNVLLIIQK